MPNLVFFIFPISRYCAKLIKINWDNFRNSNNINFKLRPVTKLDKSKKKPSIKFDDDVLSKNYDASALFPING